MELNLEEIREIEAQAKDKIMSEKYTNIVENSALVGVDMMVIELINHLNK